MGADRFTFDTNILYYALDSEGGKKHTMAADLLRSAVRADSVLLLQSLAELFNAARRRRTIPLQQVQEFIERNMDAFPIFAFESVDLLPAISLERTHRLQFWDALLTTTALRAGCSLLFSEDGQDTRRFGGLTILNPFMLSPAELGRLFSV